MEQPSDRNTEPPAPRTPLKLYTLLCVLLVSVVAVMLGYDIGVMSGAIIFMQVSLSLCSFPVKLLNMSQLEARKFKPIITNIGIVDNTKVSRSSLRPI